MSPTQNLERYLNQDAFFSQTYEYARKRFSEAATLTAHNWEHSYRDVINAITIGEAEGANMEIVLPAAVLHDIGFLYGATGRTHAALGAEHLEAFLSQGGIDCHEQKLAAIRACILTHKGSMHNEEPGSLEARVVSDADMLEKLGPIGVYQSIRTFTEFNYDARRVIQNLERMEDWSFQTPTGRKLAEDLIPFSRHFARSLQQAYKPYDTDETKEAPV